MTNIWINLQTRGWDVSMLVNLLVIRFFRDIWCQNIMITNISIRIFMYMLLWFWVRPFIINWIMMTQTCDPCDFFLNRTNLWLRNNGNIRNYIVLNWRYIMFVNAILCWRLIEMPVSNFGLMYISLLHWVPPVWVFIRKQGTHKQNDHASGNENKHFSSDHVGTHPCVISEGFFMDIFWNDLSNLKPISMSCGNYKYCLVDAAGVSDSCID